MSLFFFFNDTAGTEICKGEVTLSLHDALPIYRMNGRRMNPGVAPTSFIVLIRKRLE